MQRVAAGHVRWTVKKGSLMGRLERAGKAYEVGDARLRGQGIRKDKEMEPAFVCMTESPGWRVMVMPGVGCGKRQSDGL